jgi:hypothetical protein
LVPARYYDVFRHKPVWAVYKIPDSHSSVSRTSDFGDLDPAKATADELNRRRGGEPYYFRVYRLAAPLPDHPSSAEAGSPSD